MPLINCFFRNDWAGMIEWAEQALAAEPSSPNARVAAFSTLALGTYAVGRLDDAERATSEAAALFEAISDAELAEHDPGVAVWLSWAETCLERLGEAIGHVDRSIAVARSTGQRHLIPGMLAFETHPLRLKGRLIEAQRNADDVSELALFMESDGLRRMAMTMRSTVEVVSGDLFAAVRYAEQGAVDSDGNDPPSGIARMVLAEALLEVGEPERAREQLVSADGSPSLPQIPFCEGYGYLLLTRSELAHGAVDEAEAYAARAQEVAAKYPTLVPISSAAQAKAAVLLARGDAESARREAAAAVDCGSDSARR